MESRISLGTSTRGVPSGWDPDRPSNLGVEGLRGVGGEGGGGLYHKPYTLLRVAYVGPSRADAMLATAEHTAGLETACPGRPAETNDADGRNAVDSARKGARRRETQKAAPAHLSHTIGASRASTI